METSEKQALSFYLQYERCGPAKIRDLISNFGSARAALAATQPLWQEKPLRALPADIDTVSYDAPNFPPRLLSFRDLPLLLFTQGKQTLLNTPCVAVIGSREMSSAGEKLCWEYSAALAKNHFTVVSGLAKGIDTIAHEAALQFGDTIAVLGSGLQNIYPRENKTLAEKIKSKSLIISAYEPEAEAKREHFPQRNAIVSALSQAVLVIEAQENSGTMITILKAIKQQRPIYCLLPNLDKKKYSAQVDLIQKGLAELVSSPNELIKKLSSSPITRSNQYLFALFDRRERQFLDNMPSGQWNIHDLSKISGLPIIELNALLLGLVAKNVLRQEPNGTYMKVV